MERQALYEICRGYGLGSLLETKPREKSRSGRELEDYNAEQAEKRAQAAETRAKLAEEKNETGGNEFAENQGRENTRAETHPAGAGTGARARGQEQVTAIRGKSNPVQNGARAEDSPAAGRNERESPERVATDQKQIGAARAISNQSRTASVARTNEVG